MNPRTMNAMTDTLSDVATLPSQTTALPAAPAPAPVASTAQPNTAALPVVELAANLAAAPSAEAPKRAERPDVQPILEKLFELYPHLFGANFLPLKLGIYQELVAAHPEELPKEALKAALGVHTRSARYLQCVAAGNQRHDLAGLPVEDVAPEHIYFALLELFRRKQGRSREDLRPKFRVQAIDAFIASNLTREDFLARVRTKDEDANALLDSAFADYDLWLAKQEAMLRAFDASGKTPEEFADMYGLHPRDVTSALERRSAPNAG
jgi:ProP effector